MSDITSDEGPKECQTFTTLGYSAQLEIATIDDNLCDLLMLIRRTDLTEQRRATYERRLDREIQRLRKWRTNNNWNLF